jgi:glycosyltransferase involved in cell wall biosynthesis
MTMKKLLVVATVPETIRGFLLPWAEHFRAKGWKVDAMALDISTCTACIAAFDKVWDIQWSRNPIDPLNLVVAPRRIRQIVAQQHYDLVHVHTPVAAFVSRYALNPLRQKSALKVLYTAHGFHFHRGGSRLRNQLFVSLEKWAGNWTDELIVINQDDRKAALQYGIVPPNRLHTMPGIGLSLSHYSHQSASTKDSQRIRLELGLHPEDILFLTVAELIPRKRHADILRAIAQVQDLKVHLMVAGDGPLFSDLNTLSQQLGIEQQVHFLGYRSDIPQLMGAARSTILVSQQEGLPRSVMESLAMGIPVIGSRIRGTEDLLSQGGGRLVEVGDIESIAQAIQWMADDPEQASQMGQQGREQAQQYDIANILALHDRLYTQTLTH